MRYVNLEPKAIGSMIREKPPVALPVNPVPDKNFLDLIRADGGQPPDSENPVLVDDPPMDPAPATIDLGVECRPHGCTSEKGGAGEEDSSPERLMAVHLHFHFPIPQDSVKVYDPGSEETGRKPLHRRDFPELGRLLEGIRGLALGFATRLPDDGFAEMIDAARSLSENNGGKIFQLPRASAIRFNGLQEDFLQGLKGAGLWQGGFGDFLASAMNQFFDYQRDILAGRNPERANLRAGNMSPVSVATLRPPVLPSFSESTPLKPIAAVDADAIVGQFVARANKMLL